MSIWAFSPFIVIIRGLAISFSPSIKEASTINCCVAKLLTVFLALLNELHPANKSIADHHRKSYFYDHSLSSSSSKEQIYAQKEKPPQ